MNENNSVGGGQFAFGKANTPVEKQKDSITSPVEEADIRQTINTAVYEEEQESEDIMSSEYTHEASISISLVKNYSLYRRANDKVLPKKRDYIGGSVSASRILSSNKEEVENYFPTILGLNASHQDFTMRLKQYLNNIRIAVDELGINLDISFVYHRKSDYYKFRDAAQKIEDDFNKVDRQNLSKLKAALKDKITKLNVLESTKHKYGYPVNVDHYISYRHCLLYDDIAKDVAIINSNTSVRFYFKDDQREEDKLRKFRGEVNKAKVNYVATLSDDVLFDAVYIQYLVEERQPVIAGLLEKRMDRETKLDKFSGEEPIKFNKIVNSKHVKLIGTIELLIAHGQLQRSQFNQNITTDEGNFIGSNMKEAVAWFTNPDNNSTVDAYYNKLKNT